MHRVPPSAKTRSTTSPQSSFAFLIVLAIATHSLDAQAGTGVWTGTAPRARSIEGIARDPLQPARMWAASFGAGVYRSLDGGATWTGYRAGLANTFVRCVIPQPNHPDSVFCGTNDGVFLSVDGGISWKKQLSTSKSVRAIAIHPVRTGIVYAATYGGGIYKSTNGGANWSTINLGLGNTLVRDIALSPANPEILLAATGTGSTGPPPGPGGIFRSLNGGLTWSQLADTIGSNNGTHGAAEQIQFDRLDPSRIYVAEFDRGVLKSVDGGTSWTRVNRGLLSFNTRSLSVVDTVRYVGTTGTPSSGIFSTTLSDTIWRLVKSDVTVDALLSAPSAPNTAWAGTDGQGILRTVDRGVSWTALDGGLMNTFAFSLAVRPATHAVYVGTGFGDQFWRSLDRGSSWTRAAYLFSRNSEHGLAVDPLQSGRVYLSVYGSGVYRSDDDGATFADPDSVSGTLTNHFVRDLVAWPGQSGHLFVGTGVGPFESMDGGASWAPRLGDLPGGFAVHAMALVPTTPFRMFVGNDNLGIYRTIDGGSTWAPANAGLPVATGRAASFVHALLVDATDPSVVYAALDTLGCPNCSGVFKSANGGASWAPASAGLPVGEVRTIVQDPVHPAMLFCGVYGRGVFVSIDRGAGWQPVANQSGLADLHVRSLAVDGEVTTLYAGTENGVAAISNYPVAGAEPSAAAGVSLAAGPTPARGPLVVNYSVSRPGPISIEVFDVTGARIRTLLDATTVAPGRYTVDWDLRPEHGATSRAGLYFIRLVCPEGERTVRIVELER